MDHRSDVDTAVYAALQDFDFCDCCRDRAIAFGRRIIERIDARVVGDIVVVDSSVEYSNTPVDAATPHHSFRRVLSSVDHANAAAVPRFGAGTPPPQHSRATSFRRGQNTRSPKRAHVHGATDVAPQHDTNSRNIERRPTSRIDDPIHSHHYLLQNRLDSPDPSSNVSVAYEWPAEQEQTLCHYEVDEDEIEAKLNKYVVLDEIYTAPGTTVFRAFLDPDDANLHPKEVVVIKKIPNSERKSRGLRASITRSYEASREIAVMKKLRHPNIVSLLAVIRDENFLYLVMDYCEQGPLGVVMRPGGERHYTPIPLSTIQTSLKETLLGLKHLHKHKIIHRDIKPENILVKTHNDVQMTVISDFGVSFCVDDTEGPMTHSDAGTPVFCSPEVHKGDVGSTGKDSLARGKKSDVWSLGVTLYVWIYAVLPFCLTPTMNRYSVPQYIDEHPLRFPDAASARVRLGPTGDATADEVVLAQWNALIARMLDKDHRTRIAVEEIEHHPLLADVSTAVMYASPKAPLRPPSDAAIDNAVSTRVPFTPSAKAASFAQPVGRTAEDSPDSPFTRAQSSPPRLATRSPSTQHGSSSQSPPSPLHQSPPVVLHTPAPTGSRAPKTKSCYDGVPMPQPNFDTVPEGDPVTQTLSQATTPPASQPQTSQVPPSLHITTALNNSEDGCENSMNSAQSKFHESDKGTAMFISDPATVSSHDTPREPRTPSVGRRGTTGGGLRKPSAYITRRPSATALSGSLMPCATVHRKESLRVNVPSSLAAQYEECLRRPPTVPKFLRSGVTPLGPRRATVARAATPGSPPARAASPTKALPPGTPSGARQSIFRRRQEALPAGPPTA